MKTTPIPILSAPGIRRDGTVLDGDAHIDGRWVRWKNGRPRKMLGCRQIVDAAQGIQRAINSYPANGLLYVHMGSQERIERFVVNATTFVASGITNRTPAAFTTSDNLMWQFDQMYDAASGFNAGQTYVLAHSAITALDIADDTARPVYYGTITDTAALTAIADSSVSGGIVVFHPYAIAFGSDGFVRQSIANKPLLFTGAGSNLARVTSKKIVRGMAVRGGAGNAPSGFLWSLDKLVRASFIGGSPIFDYDEIGDIDILAAMSVVQMNGIYYWIGLGRFMMFNGVIQELPNGMNADFFFDNLNWTYRNKCFGYTVPRFGEIWWCFPKGADATECNHAVVYNVKERCWYDTELLNDGRSAADTPLSFRYPLAAGVEETAAGKTSIWQHETGYDLVAGSQTLAIRSFYETGGISMVTPPDDSKPVDAALKVALVEPDFVQVGDMTLTVTGQANPKAEATESAAQTFPAEATTAAQQMVRFQGKNIVQRHMRFRFESNEAGGYYETGKPVAHIAPADGRQTGAVPS